ncbi:MAG: long-chain fatty acid--CoA ligase [Candidatus Obscuribacterales bacterium]
MTQGIATRFFERAQKMGDRVGVRYKEQKSPYKGLSWTDYASLVRDMAFGLAALGVDSGSSVAIFSANSIYWVAADIATICNGGISVPIYPTSSQSDIQYILENSEAQIVFVQNEELCRKVVATKKEAINKIVLLNKPQKSLAELTQELGLPADQSTLASVEDILELGKKLKSENPNLIDERLSRTKLSDLATIIYTSGTTGTPKGAGLTHANILSLIEAVKQVLPVDENTVYLNYLPLSHVFERVCGEFYWMTCAGEYAFAESIEAMGKNLAEVQPTMILVVPRVMDRIYSKVRIGIEGASGRRKKLINWSIAIGKQIVGKRAEGKNISAFLQAKYWLAEKLVLGKLREKIGPRLNLVVSGGAPASTEPIEFFNAIGIDTLEGYGLTETTAPACVNLRGKVKIGTVGPTLPSINLKIGEDGEILLKGPSIFNGYYKNPEATADAFEDGWFKTGDIGEVDKDGYLKITDRKKDLIVNSAGKNIAPQRIEAILKTVPFVSQAVVFGDKQKALVALLTLDEQAATEFGREQNWEFNSYAELLTQPKLNQFLRKEIQSRSGQLADYEVVKRFAVLPDELSVDEGELTATLKIKRNVVASRYKSVIEALYRDENVDAAALVGSSKR